MDFEDLSLASESYWNGYDSIPYDPDDNPPNNEGEVHPFTSRGVAFYNYHHDGWCSDWGGYYFSYWGGWAYSNRTDNSQWGPNGQYTAMWAAGKQSPNYGIAYVGWVSPPTVSFGSDRLVQGAYFNNNAYAYGSMLNGDSFAKKFGGDSGDDADWFLLTISGTDSSGESTGSVDFYLADYRNVNGFPDYIITNWTWVDLSSLGSTVRTLEFGLTSSDTGMYGMNTPAYFAMDSMNVVPEPSTIALIVSGALVLLFCWWRRRRRSA